MQDTPAKGKTAVFSCKMCDKKFAQKGNLKRHEMIHKASSKNFFCNFCTFRASRTDVLERHLTVHMTNNK